MSKEWGNSVRIKCDGVVKDLSYKNKKEFLVKCRNELLSDAIGCIKKHKIKDPDLFMWDRIEQNGDVVYGWYIGANIGSRARSEKFSVCELLKVRTSEHVKNNSLINWAREKFLGIKPDPRKLNPYVR